MSRNMQQLLIIIWALTILQNREKMKNKVQRKKKLWFDRLLSESLSKQFAILAAVLFVLFLLSWFFLHISGCNWRDFAENSNIPEWLLPLYLLIDTNAFNNLYINGIHGWALLFSTITYVIGAFIFNGAIIAIITNAIGQRVGNHREGHIHYLRSGHYIIMGYDDMVPSIITHIFDKDKDAYVLILSAAESQYICEKLKRIFDEERMKRILVNYGHRVSTEYYKDIHLESAEEVYIVGLRTVAAHDAINVECVDSICSYLSNPRVTERPSRIVCVFRDLDTYAAFKTSDIFSDEMQRLGIEFIPYNFYTGWAKQVFIKRRYRGGCYPAVYGNGITDNDKKRVHIVFVGTTNFAVAFAMEAAHLLHFPNFIKDPGRKTLITFIDLNANKEKEEFVTRNRHLFEALGDPSDFLDVEFEFIEGNVFSQGIQEKIMGWAKNDEEYLSIFLAMANQRENFVMGMNMPDEVYDYKVPIFIRQDKSDNLVTNLRDADDKHPYQYAWVDGNGELQTEDRKARYANIYPFGMNDSAYCADDRALMQAKLINYLYDTANYGTYKFKGTLVLETMSRNQIMAEADECWKKISVALKWSNLYSAYALETKAATLRAMRGLDIDDTSHDLDALSDEEVEVIANVEHNRWNMEKLLMGYRRCRPQEDSREHPEFASDLAKNKKHFIHHDIRPFNELGDIQELDREFTRYIPWILRHSR